MADERRYLCSELVTLLYDSGSEATARLSANLEEISADEAELLLEQSLEPGTEVAFSIKDNDFYGLVESSTFDAVLGWFVRVKLHKDSRWSGQKTIPEHFLPLSTAKEDVPESGVASRH